MEIYKYSLLYVSVNKKFIQILKLFLNFKFSKCKILQTNQSHLRRVIYGIGLAAIKNARALNNYFICNIIKNLP